MCERQFRFPFHAANIPRLVGAEKLFPDCRSVLFHRAMKLTAANETPGRGISLPSWWPWLAVAAVILFVGFIRVRLLATPLERDEGEYAYAGQLILQGIPPYELVYNMKLPGTYFAYALGMALFGGTVTGIHLTLLAANSLTCIFVFLLGRRLSSAFVGVAACAAYAVMSVNPAVWGWPRTRPNLLCSSRGRAGHVLVMERLGQRQPANFFSERLHVWPRVPDEAAGNRFGLFGLAMMTWQAIEKRAPLTRDFFISLGVFGGGCSSFASFASWHSWPAISEVVVWTFEYAGKYATNRSLAEGFDALANDLRRQFPAYAGCWLLAVAGLTAAKPWRGKNRPLVFALVFLGFAFLGTAAGLYFRLHYFILLLPAFALVLGLGIESLRTSLVSRSLRWLPPALLVMALAWSVYQQQWVFFRLDLTQVCQAFIPGALLPSRCRLPALFGNTRSQMRGWPWWFRPANLFLRATAFRDRLYLHLSADGATALCRHHARGNDPGN